MSNLNITPADGNKQAQSKQALGQELDDNYSTDGKMNPSASVADVPVKVQLFTKSNGPLTKSISLDNKGNNVKDSSECRMNSGQVRTQNTTPSKLSSLLGNLASNQALALSNKDYSDGREITTKGNEHDDVISRSSNYFPFESGPAFILFDVDFCDGYPPKDLEDVLKDIETIIPEFKQAAKIIKPSTSAGIKIKEIQNDGK